MGEYRTTTGEPAPTSAPLRQRRRFRRLLFTLSTIAIVTAAGFLIQLERSFLANGYVTTENYAEVRPATVGTIAEILIKTGSSVTQGQVLAYLDMTEEQAAVEEAQSRVLQTESELARRQAEIVEEKRRHQELIAIARLRVQNTSAKLTRAQELLEKGLLAGSAMEDTMLAGKLAEAELESLLKKDQTVSEQELAARRQEIKARRDALARAAARISLKTIRAPVSGQALRYEFVVGELMRPENIMYEIFGGDRQVMKLRIPERYAARIAVGQPYKARLTSYGGLQPVWFTGQIEALRNVIQTEGQKTYRVAYGDFTSRGKIVPPGTSAEARIYFGKVNVWQYLIDL
ncbi:MAG: HlyD family efflux transporter periplasmic adaptor subunit [bacterium]|jgi:multidrug resistance efflux pump